MESEELSDKDDRNAGIRLGGEVTEEDVAEGGPVGSTTGTGTGGMADAMGGGEARGGFSDVPGAGTGGKGMSGTDVGSTNAGRTDLTGGGTASGLGGTSGNGVGV